MGQVAYGTLAGAVSNAGGLGVIGPHFLSIEAFRLAEAVLVAPFRHFNMLWAVIFGYAVWGDLPDTWVIAGTTLVIASGLYLMRREARRRGQGEYV